MKIYQIKTVKIQYLVIFVHTNETVLQHAYSNPTSAVCVTGELAFIGSAEQLSEGPCKGDLGLQWSPNVGEGARPSDRIFCAVVGWM